MGAPVNPHGCSESSFYVVFSAKKTNTTYYKAHTTCMLHTYYVYMCIYIYIYIEREREIHIHTWHAPLRLQPKPRERGRDRPRAEACSTPGAPRAAAASRRAPARYSHCRTYNICVRRIPGSSFRGKNTNSYLKPEVRSKQMARGGRGGRQMYPLLFGVFGLMALGCLGLWQFSPGTELVRRRRRPEEHHRTYHVITPHMYIYIYIYIYTYIHTYIYIYIYIYIPICHMILLLLLLL